MIKLRANLKREITHAQSIGEWDYAGDLQFIVDFIDGDIKPRHAEMVQQKTLTRRDIEHIKKLGYKVEVVQQPVSL